MTQDELRDAHSAALKLMLSMFAGYDPPIADQYKWRAHANEWWTEVWRKRRSDRVDGAGGDEVQTRIDAFY